MTAYRELIERLELRRNQHMGAAGALKRIGNLGASDLAAKDADLCHTAATALRALEAQSKDKEEEK